MARLRYHGYRGLSIQPGATARRPCYLRKGLAATRKIRRINGKIVLLSIGMSNATAEFGAFKRAHRPRPREEPEPDDRRRRPGRLGRARA